jgi:Ala-tRNA(Pro) deacylase
MSTPTNCGLSSRKLSTGILFALFDTPVIVTLDGISAMAVLPASDTVAVVRLKAAVGARTVALAKEPIVPDQCLTCEVGTMPSFGDLYTLEVWVARLAVDEAIAFNAGDQTAFVRMAYWGIDRLVQPTVGPFSAT